MSVLDQLRDEGIEIVCVADIKPEAYRWLWRYRIPAAGLTILNGQPNAGKSTIYCDIAARITTGRPMPLEEQPGTPGGVLFLATEDHYASIVRPRLEVAEADVTRVNAVLSIDGGFPWLNDSGLRKIERAIELTRPRLFVVDPLTNYIPTNLDGYKDQDVRRVLAPLASAALKYGCGGIIVRHTTQNGKRGAGSVGIGAIARSELMAEKKSDDAGTLSLRKYNNANPKLAPPVRYRFVDIKGIARLEWSSARGTTSRESPGQQAEPKQLPLDETAKTRLVLEIATKGDGSVSAADVAGALDTSVQNAARDHGLFLGSLTAKGLLEAKPGRARRITATGVAWLANKAKG